MKSARTTGISPLYVITAVNRLTMQREAISKPHTRWKAEEMCSRAREQASRKRYKSWLYLRIEPYEPSLPFLDRSAGKM